MDPSNISRTRQDCIEAWACCWDAHDHTRGIMGHKYIGLSNAWDGKEDHLIRRDARIFWDELTMDAERELQAAIGTQDVAAGRLRQWDYETVVGPVAGLDHSDVQEEGAEVDGELVAGEDPWADENEQAVGPDSGDELEAEKETIANNLASLFN